MGYDNRNLQFWLYCIFVTFYSTFYILKYLLLAYKNEKKM